MKRFWVICAAIAAVFAAATAMADTWDVTKDFSVSGNPNNEWSYGYFNNPMFQLYTASSIVDGCPQWLGNLSSDGTPLIWKNNSASTICGVAPGQISLHPGPGYQASMAVWTAPKGSEGEVRVNGQFYPGDGGAMDVAIYVNDIVQASTPVWSAVNSGLFDLNLTVKAGDTIAFAVYGGYYSGNTPLSATITTVPELGTLTMFVTGFVGLLCYAWRKRRPRI
jgi:hypothetical protein